MPVNRLCIVGHRGVTGHPEVTENTMSAFEMCFNAIVASGRGHGGIELDLQQTADGEVVIFRDDALNGSVERICEYEYEELVSICEYVPKFEEFILWLYELKRHGRLDGIRLDIILDIKPQNCSSLLLSINRLLSTYAIGDSGGVHYYLGIWTTEWLRIVELYGWPHGFLMLITDNTSVFRHLQSFDCLSIDIQFVKRNPIASLKVWWWRIVSSAKGRRLAFWTINTKRDLSICKLLGGDSVIVDDVTTIFKKLKN